MLYSGEARWQQQDEAAALQNEAASNHSRAPRRIRGMHSTHLVLGGQGTLGALSFTTQLGHGAAILADVSLQAESEVSMGSHENTEVASAKHHPQHALDLAGQSAERPAVS